MGGLLHLADMYLSFAVFKTLIGLYSLHMDYKFVYIFRKEGAM